MSDELALLEAVCTYPQDDTPRLVYADWWSEHGQEARGEFVRLQCELAVLDSWGDKGRATNNGRWADDWYGTRYGALRRRERELLDNERPAAGMLGWHVTNRALWFAGDDDEAIARTVAHDPQYTRGFVSSLTCTAADWLQHADALAWPTASVTCSRCGGKGELTRAVISVVPSPTEREDDFQVAASRETCPDCSGSRTRSLPRPTDPCDRCGGDGKAHGSDRPFEWNDRADYGKCVVCWDEKQKKSTGRVPRPFPLTAQPIEKVVLTTQPDAQYGDPQDPVQIRFPDRPWRSVGRVDETDHAGRVLRLLAAEWPWIEFEVQAGNVATVPPFAVVNPTSPDPQFPPVEWVTR